MTVRGRALRCGVLRGLAILLVFTFALLRVESLHGFGLSATADSIADSAKTPDPGRYSIEPTATRGPIVVQVDLLRLAVFHAGYSFRLSLASLAIASLSLDSTVERLVDRRALIRRLGRVQHRSPSPVG